METNSHGRAGSSASSWTPLDGVKAEHLQQVLTSHLTFAVVGLVDG